MNNKWTNEEIQKLIELFPDNYNKDIAVILSKSEHAIHLKSYRLNLKKTKEHKSACIAKRNKMVGRDITYELAKEQALLYKTRSEFQLNDSSCYNTARINGYLDDICSHMINISFSIPQLLLRDILDNILESKSLYNTRKIIQPYELDVYYQDFNIAFEYNGKGWHLNNINDVIKQQLCINKNIILLTIKENNRKYEEDIKNQLINFLPQINKITNKSILETDIINYKPNNVLLLIHNKDSLIKLAQSYDSFKIFKKDHYKEYDKICKLKIINEATQHMKDKRKIHTVDSLKIIIANYTKLLDFISNDKGAYLFIKRNNLEYLINHLIRRKRYN